MLQAMLADRFRLVIHHEDKVMAVLMLTAGKSGVRLPRAADPDGDSICKYADGPKTQSHTVCVNMSMTTFAEHLPELAPGFFLLPVIDKTGLPGGYDIHLDFMPYSRYQAATSGTDSSPDTLAVSIFDNLAAMGLKLEKGKHPMDTVVVDSAERPEN